MKQKFLLVLYFLLFLFTAKAANFEQAFVKTIQFEGVAFTAFFYDNDGGGTKYGFTLKRYQQIAKIEGWRSYDNDADGKITKNDLRIIKLRQVKHLYKKYYWDVVGGDLIASQMTAECLYDYLINGGLSVKKIQDWAGVPPDGKLGKKTIQAINKKGECKYSALVLKDRGIWLFIKMKKYRPTTYQVCKRGWANRVNIQVSTFNKKCNEKLSFYRV